MVVCLDVQELLELSRREWSTDGQSWTAVYGESSFPWAHLPQELLWAVIEFKK